MNVASFAPPRDASAKCDPIAAARALLDHLAIRAPHEIEVELMAWHLGVPVRWRDTGTADARVVIAGDRARIAVAKWARGTPRARFSIAHELAHLLLHRDFDSIARIHGAPRGSREHRIEIEADRFAAELLVPASFAAPSCVDVAEPTLDHVASLASAFRVSLSVAARRFAQLATAPCAFVEARGGRVARAVRSESFRGIAVGGRALHEESLAYDLLANGGNGGTRTQARAWGAAFVEGEAIDEECVRIASDTVLVWLRHRA